MAGYQNYNWDGFAAMADVLRQRGHVPVNPHHVDPDHAGPCRGAPLPHRPHHYGCYLHASIAALLDSDAAVFMPGWESSRGARIEREIALAFGVEIIEVTP